MFSIAVEPTYTADVAGELAGGSEFRFQAIFRRLTVADLRALNEKVAAGASDAEVVGRVLAGWEGVLDEAREPLPFTPENLFRVLNIIGVQPAIVETYYASLPGARRKN